MMIKEAFSVLWQTFKNTWEELYSLAIVNLVWLLSWGLPLALVANLQSAAIMIPTMVLSALLFTVTMSGIYHVTSRVARGTTFHFSDFIDGIKLYWWRSLLWLLANVVAFFLISTNLRFYPTILQGTWVIIIGGFWMSVLFFWTIMQFYFWPILVQQEQPKILLAWRNAAYLILASPFYAFLMVFFAAVLIVASVGLVLPLIFVGMAIIALLGSTASLELLVKFKIIEDPRPKPSF
jgi:hypothetical protein